MDNIQTLLTQGKPLPENVSFDDQRLNDLLFRLQARHQPEQLSEQEKIRWRQFCHNRVHKGNEGFRTIADYENALIQLEASEKSKNYPDMINQLRNYGKQVAAFS